ncbi:MAG TPA: hypothetical protein VK756_01950 [Solirubrobacteraceae bacterium]|nr:hypothetical protein [Solirubrobacteraceae bacterium]
MDAKAVCPDQAQRPANSRGLRLDRCAQAVTSRVNRWQAHDIDAGPTWPAQDGALVVRQLAPGEGVERGGWAWRNGTHAHAAIRDSQHPAPTVFFGHGANTVERVPSAPEPRQGGARPRQIEEPAATMFAVGLAKGTPAWAGTRPATTVACDRRVHPPGHKHNSSDPPGRYQQRRGAHAVRVTIEQAAILQDFPADYPWQGCPHPPV